MGRIKIEVHKPDKPEVLAITAARLDSSKGVITDVRGASPFASATDDDAAGP
jgi:hypothetical protein